MSKVDETPCERERGWRALASRVYTYTKVVETPCVVCECRGMREEGRVRGASSTGAVANTACKVTHNINEVPYMCVHER